MRLLRLNLDLRAASRDGSYRAVDGGCGVVGGVRLPPPRGRPVLGDKRPAAGGPGGGCGGEAPGALAAIPMRRGTRVRVKRSKYSLIVPAPERRAAIRRTAITLQECCGLSGSSLSLSAIRPSS